MAKAAELIKDARRASGLTQSALAQRSGFTQSVISEYETGRREPSFGAVDRLVSAAGLVIEVRRPEQDGSSMLRRIMARAPEIRERLEPYGVSEIRVFGSVARGEDTEASDIDLLVGIPPSAGMFDLLRMQREVEDLLGRTVDLVPRTGLKPAVAEAIALESIEL